MGRTEIINKIGKKYHTENIEGGEWSYVVDAGNKKKLKKALGKDFNHFKLDIRFENPDIVVLVETKQEQVDSDKAQLQEYLEEEKALHGDKDVICILANTKDEKIKVWKNEISDKTFLPEEKVIDKISHYQSLFEEKFENDRLTVIQNTNKLNVLLHSKDIDEDLRSQFVGTTLLYIQNEIQKLKIKKIDSAFIESFEADLKKLEPGQIIAGIKDTLNNLLNESKNKDLKIKLLQKNVLDNQKVKSLSTKSWVEILSFITYKIYKYINQNSAEGQDILNLFFITFNKYAGKKDKNQAFTPDHITEFMCEVTGVNKDKRVFDGTCGSGSFLVQAMVKELRDCEKSKLDEKKKTKLKQTIAKKHIYGIEIEDKAYGLSTTNMLIHGDGNSNILQANLFDKTGREFIKEANPDIILMNPPYNAKPVNITAKEYKKDWKKAEDGKNDPTKGLVFVRFISDQIKAINHKKKRLVKEVKMAVLLPVSCAIGTDKLIKKEKNKLLEDNTLEAVFTLPNDIFHPGASPSVCCMVFTLGKPHFDNDGKPNQKTFFGYFKEDGFRKKKNLGRVEQFDKDGQSEWKKKEKMWLDLYKNKTVVDGLSAMRSVTGEDEWLCEAYMKTDYSKLSQDNFQKTLNSYLAYLVKEGEVYES